MEASVETKLKDLFILQLIDSKIDKIKSVRGELPMEVNDLEDEIAGLETRLSKLEDDAKGLEQSIVKQRESIKKAQELILKYESQQSNVKNNREYVALTKELELQKLEVMAAEKKIKDFDEQIKHKNEIIETSAKQLEDKKENLEAKKKELDHIIGETEKDEAEMMKLREKKVTAIEDRLAGAYKRIRRSVVNGLAVVTIERDACAGCFSKIPPQRQVDIRQRKKIIVCENCGRILIDNALSLEIKDSKVLK